MTEPELMKLRTQVNAQGVVLLSILAWLRLQGTLPRTSREPFEKLLEDMLNRTYRQGQAVVPIQPAQILAEAKELLDCLNWNPLSPTNTPPNGPD